MTAAQFAFTLLFALSSQAAVITVSALVVDESGAPLANVVVDGLYFSRTAFARTGEDGRVESRTSFPRLAFRKPGYQTVVAAPEVSMKIVMKTPRFSSFPRCANAPVEFEPLFRLPPQPSARPNQDADYNGSFIQVTTAKGTSTLTHGYGPNWSEGYPPYQDLMKSDTYNEINVLSDASERIGITVANGTLPDGTSWRYLGRRGESLSYWTRDLEAAKSFDAIMDKVCLALPRFKGPAK